MLVKQSFINKAVLASIITATTALFAASAQADLDPSITNAPFQIVIPNGIQVVLEDISPNASDPSLIFRITAMVTNSWFDAIAPYHPSAVGVYSTIAARPASERTDENRNIAILHASYQVLTNLLPNRNALWRKMLTDAGLNPDDQSTDLNTPVGIGNVAGKAVIDARLNDGFNQLGNEGGCVYNCIPYSDYTEYASRNTPHKLNSPSHWQPKIVPRGNGLFDIQQFVNPQLAATQAYTYKKPNRFLAPFPVDSQVENYRAYKDQVDVVLDASANLTDEQKMMAELFDNKFNSMLAAAASVAPLLELGLEESVIIEFATNVAAFDTAIAIWYSKRKFDAVRPFSAIQHVYKKRPVTAWGGPGRGAVNDLPANQWNSYLPVGNHPEYPSGTASLCAAHAQVMRRLHGENNLQFTVDLLAGSSRIEPGFTPAYDLSLTWTNWTDFENDCGQSRVWAGVHFPASVPAGIDVGHKIANITYRFVQDHLAGKKTALQE